MIPKLTLRPQILSSCVTLSTFLQAVSVGTCLKPVLSLPPEEPDTHREYTWPQVPGLMTKSGPTRFQAAPTSSLAPGQPWAWTPKNDTGLITRWVTLAGFFKLLINRMEVCVPKDSLAVWEARLAGCSNVWCHLDELGFGPPPSILFWWKAWLVTSGTPHFQSKSVLYLPLPDKWHHLSPGWLQHLKLLKEDVHES